MRNVTHVGRAINIRNPSNLFAVLVGAAFALVAWLLDAAPITAGGSAFLAWALGREIDPDRVLTANLAVIVGGAAAICFDGASLGAIYLFLIAARIVARTTGLAPRTGDLAAHVVIAGFVARSTVGWVAALVLATAVALDARTEPPAGKSQYGWAVAIAVVATVVAAVNGFELWTNSLPEAWAVSCFGLIGGLIARRREPVTAVADITGALLRPERIALARSTVFLGALAMAIVTLGPGIDATAGVWAALTAAGAVRLLNR